MAPDIQPKAGPCAALAASGGGAAGLWLGALAWGLPSGVFLVCSACVLIGAVALVRGVTGVPRRVGVAAAGALGACWCVVAVLAARYPDAAFFAVLMSGMMLAEAARSGAQHRAAALPDAAGWTQAWDDAPADGLTAPKRDEPVLLASCGQG